MIKSFVPLLQNISVQQLCSSVQQLCSTLGLSGARLGEWRWLCPIPKVVDTNIPEGRRPDMLLRKCWIGLIVLKITQVWNKHDIYILLNMDFDPSEVQILPFFVFR